MVEVLDSHGHPFPRVRANWSVTSGGGSLSPTIAWTDQRGRATATAVADTVAGLQPVEAMVAGLDPVISSATALSGPPAEIIISPVPSPLQVGQTHQLNVRVLDQYRNEITPIFLDWISSNFFVGAAGGRGGPGVSGAAVTDLSVTNPSMNERWV